MRFPSLIEKIIYYLGSDFDEHSLLQFMASLVKKTGIQPIYDPPINAESAIEE